MTELNETRQVRVIGHRNPDTDSICSAIAYAYLKNQASDMVCEARRQGVVNRETEFALRHFGVEAPRLCTDVSPQVKDIDIRREEAVLGEMSLKQAWARMRDHSIDTLAIADHEDNLEGVITVKDIATANMDTFDVDVLAKAKTSYKNLLDTLNGTLEVGDENAIIESGRLCVGAGNPESLEKFVQPGDLVILANRYESQFCAIEMSAGCIVVCMGAEVPQTIRRLATEKGVAVICTPYDTYAASRLISQAAPIRYYMTRTDLLTFGLNTPVEDAQKVMAKVRHRYFPVLDEEGKYCGVISRRNLLNMHRKQLILVDHNERAQAVEGYEKAEILEIIDHHRLGDLETGGPVYFRNMPVGCTSTIIFQMFLENQVDIPQHIAGLMLSAILSDTLMFRSPTSTPQDEQAAHALARIAGEDIESYADAMFEAGGDLAGKSAEEVFLQDFKMFTCGDHRFGVGQNSFMTVKNREAAQKLLLPYLEQARQRNNLEMLFYMFTDVRNTTSNLAMCGENAVGIIEEAFNVEVGGEEMAVLPGVVSRKKQLIPALMAVLSQ